MTCRNYWRDHDTALFILKHLYREIPEDPILHTESSGGTSKDKIGSTGWYDNSEAAEEELPLTFSDRMMARNFSRKAKKYMKSPWVLTEVLVAVCQMQMQLHTTGLGLIVYLKCLCTNCIIRLGGRSMILMQLQRF